MDVIYRRQRHIYDATRKYFLLGRDRLIRALRPPANGTILEIGCGTCRNLIAAARAYPDARLFGLDISAAMLSTARANLRQAGLEDRIMLARGDATRFDPVALFGRGDFDRVFLSYSLSMIPAWREAAARALELVVPDGGRFLVVDFGQQERLPGWFSHLLFNWLARFHVKPCAELRTVLSALGCAKGRSLVFRPLYRGYAWQAEIST
jgi:S-adenosylmethionine-diacylgycerolhomoserine-N-methlytransferase